ncbi:MAG TPA: GntR family transcriptional regulator [Vicinamibacterales bacterium]
MKRAARLNVLPVFLDPAAAMPLWRQLSISLRLAIACGQLGPGERLPSTRQLARQLNVSRNTVVAAYDNLAVRGLLIGCTGAGSFVAAAVPSFTPVQIWFRDVSGNRLALASLP